MKNINEDIRKAIQEMGFVELSPIQEKAIPLLDNGQDVIGQAQTGTGKTAAFGIPLIHKIDPELNKVQGIILCPTRELAMQVSEEIRKFLKYTKDIKVTAIFGGQDMTRQIQALKTTKIVVGTPGRVMDHMRRRTLKLDSIKMAVLDEADEMLNMGFREDIETILGSIDHDIQIALFSATMPRAIIDIANTYQKNAILVKTLNKTLTLPQIEQYYFNIKSNQKTLLLARLIDFYQPNKSMVFCKTKRGADTLTGEMNYLGYNAVALHGDLSQGQRNAAMAQFRSGKARMIIATDVAARGIDVDDVEAVFNYDIPLEEEYYVHRIGRTGRAGKSGTAFTFVVGRETAKLRKIEEYCKTKITPGTIPSAELIIKAKADKVFKKATLALAKKDPTTIKDMIYKYCEDNDVTVDNMAAALLMEQLGGETQDINTDTSHGRDGRDRNRSNDRDRGRDNNRNDRGRSSRDHRSDSSYRGKSKNSSSRKRKDK
ncbi:MAG: DEAD/DEAH box helicase [Peptostreptococcaceae bacterium]|nr:DEAD/DEAH box helicase [Peptostreptococcaceae bacterium]